MDRTGEREAYLDFVKRKLKRSGEIQSQVFRNSSGAEVWWGHRGEETNGEMVRMEAQGSLSPWAGKNF